MKILPHTLTGALADKNSPIHSFFRSRLPNLRTFLKQPRKLVRAVHADGKVILPAVREGYPYGPIGSAIDFRIRYYFKANEMGWVEHLPLPGGSQFTEGLTRLLKRIDPPRKRLEQQDEDELNRYCIALGYFDALQRGFATPADIDYSSAMDLVERPQDFWLKDMRSMSWTFYETLGHLLTRPFKMSPRMPSLVADADLIVDGTVIEIKTGIRPEILSDSLRQLVGYALLDTSDAFGIDSIALYLSRQGLYFKWDLQEALRELFGEPALTTRDVKAQFEDVLSSHRWYLGELRHESEYLDE